MKGFIKGTSTDQVIEFYKKYINIDEATTVLVREDTKEEIDPMNVVITDLGNEESILVVNSKSVPVNISHFQGTSRERFTYFMERIENETMLTVVPKNLTLITTFTNPDKCILYRQLNKNGISCINAFKGDPNNVVWNMTNKIGYILSALDEVKTEYALIMDGYDVLINSFDNLIQKFRNTGLRMLFNGTKNNFPLTHVDRIHNRDWRGDWRYFNAGIGIGYVEDFKKFYKDCFDILDSVYNPWQSEQYILRTVFARYSEKVDTPEAYMDFDWKCELFQTYINAINAKVYENIYAIL